MIEKQKRKTTAYSRLLNFFTSPNVRSAKWERVLLSSSKTASYLEKGYAPGAYVPYLLDIDE